MFPKRLGHNHSVAFETSGDDTAQGNCAYSFSGFIAVAVVYIFVIASRTSDDIAGGVAMGLFLTVSSLVIAAVAAKLERTVGKGIQTPQKT